MPGDSNYLSQHFGEAASLGLLEAKGSCRQDVGLQAISSTLRSVYAWEADVCYPLGHASGNLATLWLRKPLEIAVFTSDTREFRPSAHTCFSRNLSQPLTLGCRQLLLSQAGCGRVLPCPQHSQGSRPRSQLSTSCILMAV